MIVLVDVYRWIEISLAKILLFCEIHKTFVIFFVISPIFFYLCRRKPKQNDIMLKIYHFLTGSFVGITVMIATLMFTAACSHRQQNESKQTAAGNLIDEAFAARNYERVLTLCDSLEQRGDISLIKAALRRGWAYRYLGKPKAQEKELRRALAEKPKNTNDSLQYFDAATQLSTYCSIAGDNNEALEVALPTLEGLREMDREHPSEKVASLLIDLTKLVGKIQMSLGMKEEADKMFEESYSYAQRMPLETPAAYRNRFLIINGYIAGYFNAGDMASAEKWLMRQDSVTAMIRERGGLQPADSEMVMATSYINHANVAAGLNRPEEFNRAVAAYKTTKYAQSNLGKVNLASVLLETKQYAEAADEYGVLDQFFADTGKDLSLDNLGWYGEKFRANYKADRRDTALAVAYLIIENLDSAIAKQKKSDAAELATIYQTQQKDAEIAQQQISLSRQRLIGTLVVLVLLTTFFIIYTWYRRRAENRLAAAHESLEKAHTELKTAYDQLEETTAAKERIESELRIAREIQMSMVPQEFPQYEGLDMYAVMNAAKEVGGDLYGYVLQGNMLHFCLGDVSGKGVPASLFMSQSARLFRTLAAEGLSPADIAFRMNKGLAENNKRMMFVTMFIGQLHLDTGRLDFCNCGHNPPVLDGQFLEMKYENHPLGFWEDDPFDGETIDDIRGRQLLIYTDGLNEAENGQQEQFGDDRLLELMADMQNLSSREVIDRLKEAVEQHRAGVEPNDDLTLMCVRLEKIK